MWRVVWWTNLGCCCRLSSQSDRHILQLVRTYCRLLQSDMGIVSIDATAGAGVGRNWTEGQIGRRVPGRQSSKWLLLLHLLFFSVAQSKVIRGFRAEKLKFFRNYFFFVSQTVTIVPGLWNIYSDKSVYLTWQNCRSKYLIHFFPKKGLHRNFCQSKI